MHMVDIRKKELWSYVIVMILFLLSGAVHILAKIYPLRLKSNILILVFYSLAIEIWFQKINKKMIYRSVHRILYKITACLFALMLVRTIRYELIPQNLPLSRYTWYSYYLFLTVLALLIHRLILYVGKSEQDKINPYWRLLYIPALIFSGLFLTNDYHQLIFIFTREGTQTLVKYGLFFYLYVAFLAVVMALNVFLTYKKCSFKRNIGALWHTFLPLLTWGIYTFLYIIDWPPFFWIKTAFKSPELNSIIILWFIDSLIYSGLLPSNNFYDQFWQLSSLKMGIIDWSGAFFESQHLEETEGITKDQILLAQSEPIKLNDHTMLTSRQIRGGLCFWLEDISELEDLRVKLKAVGDVKSEENDLIRAENQMHKERHLLAEQKKIYQSIQERLQDKSRQVKAIIDQLPADEPLFSTAMKQASLINVYIKRYANLILLSQQSNQLDLDELKLAFQESLEYLQLNAVTTDLVWKSGATVANEDGLLLYELFQLAIENILPAMQSLLVVFQVVGHTLKLVLQFDLTEPFSLKEILQGRLSQRSDLVFYEQREDNSLTMSFHLKTGFFSSNKEGPDAFG